MTATQVTASSIAMASVSAFTVTCKRKQIVLAISDKLKICQLVKGGRTLQSVVDKYMVSTNPPFMIS